MLFLRESLDAAAERCGYSLIVSEKIYKFQTEHLDGLQLLIDTDHDCKKVIKLAAAIERRN